MSLTLYNSLARNHEGFVPQDPERVTMYVCGPTVYGTPHLGNARPAVVFDVLFRVLLARYPRVIFARNITDIDDKIIAAAKANGETIEALTTRTTAEYHAIVDQLGCLRPTIEPTATGSVAAMITMIERLIRYEHAYEAEGHVLFSVPSFPEHGILSRHEQDALQSGHRVAVEAYKRHPSDFVLWKPSVDDQPGFDSPWGFGRPGWHIECSAMIAEHLGPTIDIHGGGQDLRFPHHDCEASQSQCAHGSPLARYWVHNGLLTFGGAKMAKSVGNVQTVADYLAQGYTGEEIRLALLMTHYRQPADWSNPPEILGLARAALDRWRNALRPHHLVAAEEVATAVEDWLHDDLNTPAAIAEMHNLAGALARGQDPVGTVNAMRRGAKLLGVLSDLVEQGRPLPAELQALLAQRIAARAVRDWAMADRLRDTLEAAGIGLKDDKAITVWWWKGRTNEAA
jgi:cysteinyl-tRNA synthetase